MILVPPSTGHVNPICGMVNELCKQKDVRVTFYSDEGFRESVEKTGARFRQFSHPTFSELPKVNINDARDPIGVMINCQISFSYKLMPQLISDVEKERPDLIIYDCVFLPAKYLLAILKSRYERGVSTVLPPKSIMFLPNFPVTEKLVKEGRNNSKISIMSTLLILWAFLRQILFSFWFRISIYNPIKLFSTKNDKLNIAALIKELTPYPDELDNTYKFVGPCVSEQARSYEVKNDPELKAIMDQFEVKSQIEREKYTENKLKLVYVSLGTVFNFNSFIFEKVIEAIRVYNCGQSHRHLKSAQFRVIISAGEDGLKQLTEKVARGAIQIPENILLRSRVPQLEILKRADLFITHCGMNSTSEAIKFAVPMVAIPLEADQPMVARRVCDDLFLGIRLNPIMLDSDQIADSIDRVLSNEKYMRNIKELSVISAKYNGPAEGAKLVFEQLNQYEELNHSKLE